MKIAIIGSRVLPERGYVEGVIDNLIYHLPRNTLIISGGASGVDTIIENMATWHRREFLKVTPNYDKECELGVQIYHDRNDKIIEMADKVIAIWNGNKVCSGTYSVITKCLKRKKNIEVIFVE